MIQFDANKLLKEMENDHKTLIEKEKFLEKTLKQIGYKNNTCCGKNTMEKRLGKSTSLISLVSYSYSKGNGFSLHYSIGVKTKDKSLMYIADKSRDTYYLCGLINYVLTNKKSLIFEVEQTWSKNQLQFSWNDNQFREMVDFLLKIDNKLSKRYETLENIINDYLTQAEYIKNFMLQNGKSFREYGQDYAYLAVLYYLFKDYENAIKMVEKSLEIDMNYLGNNHYLVLQTIAYLDYLKTGNPLPYIPSPADKISVLKSTNEDIYICLNKKTIKDEDILEYFGGKKRFEKAKKIECEEINSNDGVSICKAGKWTIVKLSFELIANYSQDDLEKMLSDMSAKYNRAILFINQDTTNTFGFEVYKKGELIRRWISGDGEVFENIGKPLTGEKKRFVDSPEDEIDANSVSEFLNEFLKITHGDTKKAVSYMIK